MTNFEKDINVIGVDIGGTHIRAGKIRNGEIIDVAACLVPETDDPMFIVNKVIETIHTVIDNTVMGIGLGIPSLVDREKGIVYDVLNIPSWKEVHLKDALVKEFNSKIFLDNDANCFTLGERKYGKGKGVSNFVGLTIGTGIGAGIINRSKLLYASNSGAGEFGMLPYKDSIFEDYCSGKFFDREYGMCGNNTFLRAKAGEPTAIEIFKQFGMHMGNMLKAIMFTIDPEVIILGGSVAKSRKFFKDSMLEELSSFPYQNAKDNIKVDFSDITHPGILGAAALCFGDNV